MQKDLYCPEHAASRPKLRAFYFEEKKVILVLLLAMYFVAGLVWGYALFGIEDENKSPFHILNEAEKAFAKISESL